MTEADSEGRGMCLVPLPGELDMRVAEEMRAQLGAALRPGTRRVVVDFAAVTFIDSSAIGELVQFRRGCETAGVGLVLRELPRAARRVLEIAGVLTLFDVAEETDLDSSTG